LVRILYGTLFNYHEEHPHQHVDQGILMLVGLHLGESAMQYTLILTEKTECGIQVTIPALPACTVEAATRDEAIRLACEANAQLVSRSEIVQIDVPQQPWATAQPRRVPWQWFGEAKADPMWEALFDEIKQRREAMRDVK
jgi:hypothetical protein